MNVWEDANEANDDLLRVRYGLEMYCGVGSNMIYNGRKNGSLTPS